MALSRSGRHLRLDRDEDSLVCRIGRMARTGEFTMWKFIVKRLIQGIVIIFLGSLIIYAVIRCLPTSFVEDMARQRAAQASSVGGKSYQEWLNQLNQVYGLDRGILPGFFAWLRKAVRGDFGDSWKYNVTVTEKFHEVIGCTLYLNIVTFLLELLICIPLGITAARKQYSRTDYAITVFALLGISLPTFFLATLLKYVFSVRLGWVDMYGLVGRNFYKMDAFHQLLDMGAHMLMPVVTLTIAGLGGLTRFTRTNMLEVLNADYIRTARAKGLPESRVISRHAFRNTLIPLVTYMSYLIPSMFSGSMITEQLFQIPGIGYTSYQAIVSGDIPFTMFYSTFLLILTQLSLLLADIMYAVVDPRVRIH